MDWCLRQATGDWLLWLDDDELMHAGFREAIEPVLSQRRLTHAYLQSRAVVETPEGHGWLRSFPWYPDARLRLVRNTGSIFWHRGRLHSPIEVHGDGVRLASDETSIYHLDLLLRSRTEREAKVERYRVSNAPSCEEYYLYEDYPGGQVSAPIDADVVQLATVAGGARGGMAATGAPASGGRPEAA